MNRVGIVVFLVLTGLGWRAGMPVRAAEPINPHGEFIFRVTGTTSCNACHVFSAESGRPLLSNNEAVRSLIARGKGNHGPGRFADCFRCHAGGRLPGDRY